MIYLAYTVALILVLVCLFAVLVILMQRPSANAGMGAALGGGAAESVFGGDSANVLNKITYTLITLFFVLCFGLYLGFMVAGTSKSGTGALDQLTQGETIPASQPGLAPANPTTPAPENGTPAATPPAATETAPPPPAPESQS